MTKPTITKGVTVVEGQEYPYAGLILGKTEYRIYEDREGWFVGGDFTAVVPSSHQAKAIRRAIQQAKPDSFIEYLAGRMEKWRLKEMAQI